MKCPFLSVILASLASGIGAGASTINFDGKTYQTEGYLIQIEAEIGQSTTESIAVYTGDTTEFAVAAALETSAFKNDGQVTYAFNSDASLIDLYTFSDNTSFSVSNTASVQQDDSWFFLFDLTFAPDIGLVANDSRYEIFGATPGSPQAELHLSVFWDQFMVTDPTHPDFDPSLLYNPDQYDGSSSPVVEFFDNSSDVSIHAIEGIVSGGSTLPAPIPLPASGWLLGFGLIFLRIFRRRSTI